MANQGRKKRSRDCELDEVGQQKTEKRQKITLKASSSSDKVPVLSNPVENPEKALRAIELKVQYADVILKAKYSKVIDKSNNKGEVMKMLERKKQVMTRKEFKEKARIEAVIEASRSKLRHDAWLVLTKTEEEAKARPLMEDNSKAVDEFVKLCGGSHMARRRWVEVRFGLFLRRDEEIEEAACVDLEEGEIF